MLDHMIRGTCEPGDVQSVLKSFDDGVSAGISAELDAHADLQTGSSFVEFREHGLDDPKMTTLAGRIWSRSRLFSQATELVASGQRCSVMILDPSPRYHRVYFHRDGFWVQSGGMFGKSDRNDPLIYPWRFALREQREIVRTLNIRQP